MRQNATPENAVEVPNDVTLQAMRELEAGGGIRVSNMDEYRKVVYGDEAGCDSCPALQSRRAAL